MSDKSKSIQQKMSDLSEIVAWFQGEEFALEEAVSRFEKAEKLAEEIDGDLTKLKNDITVIKQRFDQAS